MILMAFLLSFCGLSYQFLVARLMGEYFTDEVLCQSLVLGVFLASMGMGSVLVSRLQGNATRNFFRFEIALAGFGAILGPLLFFSKILIVIWGPEHFIFQQEPGRQVLFLFVGLMCSVALGLFTGAEMPLLFEIQRQRQGGNNYLILGASYLGGLVAALATNFVLFPYLHLVRSGIVLALINTVIAGLILWLFLRKEYFLRGALLLGLVLVLLQSALVGTPWLEQRALRAQYLDFHFKSARLEDFTQIWRMLEATKNVERIISPYQTIDILPDGFFELDGIAYEFSLYINGQPQFSRESIKPYHEVMVQGALNLAQRIPRNVLVLGGGDGFVVQELLRSPEIESITLVELDPKMIELSNTHPVLRELNGLALQNSKVKVLITDAYEFLKNNQEKFDAAFVDFPFPFSYELSRLYSVEFYRSLQTNLKEDAFFVFDAPFWKTRESGEQETSTSDIIFNTLSAAGLRSIFAFGPLEAFVLVEKQREITGFDYSRFPSHLQGRSRLNLTSNGHLFPRREFDSRSVNSVYKPVRFR